jgi:hypothetical protein
MIQNVDYEVPYLRKQMAKCSQQMADAERRHAEYVRSASQCATNYKKVGVTRGSEAGVACCYMYSASTTEGHVWTSSA